MGSIWSVRSRRVQPVNSPVCVLSRAVGMQEHSTPVAETTGSATVSEHLPKPEMSCMAAILFTPFDVFHVRYCITEAAARQGAGELWRPAPVQML